MKLLNIIYNEQLINHNKLDYVNYLTLNDSEVIDHNKLCVGPILVIGFKLYKRLYHYSIYDVDILKKEVVKNTLYWEFSYSENKSQFFDGIFDFVFKKPLEHYYSVVKYKILDPVFNNIETENDVYNLITKCKGPNYCYEYNDMLYVYHPKNKIIYGIDLVAYNYFGFDTIDIRNEIVATHHHFYDKNSEIYQRYHKQFPHVENLKRYLAPLLENQSE